MDNNLELLFIEELQNSSDAISNTDIDYLLELATSNTFKYKYNLPALLMQNPSKKVETALLKLAKEKDYLTRVQAVDSLSIGVLEDTVETLLNLMKNDSDYLVRAYSVLSYFDVLENRFYRDIDNEFDEEKIYNRLFELYMKEGHPIVQVAYFTIFYKLGEKQYFVDLVDSWKNNLSEDDASFRRWILNAFRDFVYEFDEEWYDENIVEIIKNFLMEYLPVEKNQGLKTDISLFLSDINDMFKEK